MGAKAFLEPISESSDSDSSAGPGDGACRCGAAGAPADAWGWGRAGPDLEPCLGVHLPGGGGVWIKDPIKEPGCPLLLSLDNKV